MLINPYITVDKGTNEKFNWTSICKITCRALYEEKRLEILYLILKFSWIVLKKILECLSGVMEFRNMIFSTGEIWVNKLIQGIINLQSRYEFHQLENVETIEISKYLCPLLGKLLNYSHDIQICRILIQSIKNGCIQVIFLF